MSKLILIVVFVILAIGAYFALKGLSGKCQSYNEAQCKVKLVCKPFYEYGIHCADVGCKEDERFKECTPRF